MAALVEAADVVIESARPRALARFGLSAAGAAADGTPSGSPITAYSRASGRVGFGDDVAAGTGLVAREADGGPPLFCGDAIADPLTGLAAAVLAACVPARREHCWISRCPRWSRPPLGQGEDAGSVRMPPAPGANGWTVDTASGPVPVAAPRRRQASGPAAGPCCLWVQQHPRKVFVAELWDQLA